MSPTSSGMRGGQPLTTQPTAAPWLSPKVATRNRWPKVLNDMAWPLGGWGIPRVRSGQIPAALSGSAVAAHAAVREAIDHALAYVDRGRFGGGGRGEGARHAPRPA